MKRFLIGSVVVAVVMVLSADIARADRGRRHVHIYASATTSYYVPTTYSSPMVVTAPTYVVPAVATSTVIATPTVGDGPQAVVIDPSGARAYVANTNDGSITVLDTTDNSVVGTISVGAQPVALAMNSTGSEVESPKPRMSYRITR